MVVAAIAMKPYRLRRMVSFMNPWNDPQGSGFQIIQSFLALGSGGWLGRGLGDSKQKLFYLPEAHTDFIFAIVGEELGLAGAVVVVALFVLLVWRGLRIGLRAPDAFGSYLALGLTIMLATPPDKTASFADGFPEATAGLNVRRHMGPCHAGRRSSLDATLLGLRVPLTTWR